MMHRAHFDRIQAVAGGIAFVSSFGDASFGAGFPSGGNEIAPA
jgi:hypothetical protein